MTLRLEGKWMIAAGAVWIAAALLIPALALEHRATQTISFNGVVDFATSNSGTLIFEGGLGVTRFIALAVASAFCLFIGVALCVFGSSPKRPEAIPQSRSDAELN